MLKKFLFLPNHSIRVCVKGKRINRGIGYQLEIPAEYIFYGNEKAIQWPKRTLDGADGNVRKKVLRFVKQSYFEKKSVVSYLCFVFTGLSAIRSQFSQG